MTLAALLLAVGLSDVTDAQVPVSDRGDVLFLVELAESAASSDAPSLILDVVFYGAAPESSQVDGVLRSSLYAGITMHADKDIAARAWLRATPTSVQRRPLPLGNGADGLRYTAQDESIHDGPGGTPAPVQEEDPENDHLAAVVSDGKVVEDCGGLTGVDADTLAGVALEQLGAERSIVVKAMRDWSTAHDVPLDRKLRVCMSAISKAVIAIKVEPTLSPEELAAAVARGKSAYGTHGCTNCHRATGAGGPRGADLTDDVWDHCDGSMASIAEVILSGVPQSKLKDSTRPSGMRPTSELSRGDPELTDLAAYVHSLSR